MRSRLLLFPLMLAFIACPGPAEEPAVVADDAESRRQVEQLRDNWVAAAERNDAAAVSALYAEDAVFVTTEGGAQRGRSAIQQSLAESFPVSTLENVSSERLDISGNLAVDHGEFTQRIELPNQPAQTIRGHYSVTLQRQADGSWLIVRHLSTTPQPAPQPAPQTR